MTQGKKEYFNNLIKKVSDNKTFWKTIKPFSSKFWTLKKKTFTGDEDILNFMNNLFTKIAIALSQLSPIYKKGP